MTNPDLITEPAELAVTLVEAKEHLNYDLPDKDALILGYLRSAILRCEEYSGWDYITRTWRLYLDCWLPYRIILPHPPLISVASVEYDDVDGAQQTLDGSVYEVDIRKTPGKIQLRPNQSWPQLDTSKNLNRIRITFDAGHGPNLADVPDWGRQAILFLVAHWFQERTPIGSTSVAPLPFTVEALLFPNKLRRV